MAVTTLISKVRATTKSTVALGVTDDNVVDFLTAGCRFVMASVHKQLLASYAEGVTVSDANGYAYLDNTILAVERNGSTAEFLPQDTYYSENVSSASSLFARSKLFPGVYDLRGKLYIKPDPTAGEPGTITCVKVPTLLSGSVSVFGILEEAVTRYACAQDFLALSGVFRDKMLVELAEIKVYFTTFSSALPSYSEVSAVLPSTPTTTLATPSFSYVAPVVSPDYTTMDSNIASDDVEVAQVVAAKLNAQINEFQTKVQNESERIESETKEFASLVQEFTAEWSSYQVDVEAIVSKYGVDVQAETSEFRSLLEKAMSYLQEAQAHIPLMNEYSRLALLNAEKSTAQFGLAYKFLQTYTTKFMEPQRQGGE